MPVKGMEGKTSSSIFCVLLV